ncbi:MAG: histidine triad nucleotide-binding protein [Candidatus Portnoybacteria bacterium RBG_13_40_8]|uniref:Histidine triad nucleotide-binding protein n=1 Tax=Candidatus Portnoybacteria bacterium RBG_13_40_8 TaxID=1801990 RepID=A0A1G2F5C3_9BACT|nr:MAG: histidine triad nucleotide-binding protein [Candidatus Portnoybacteria bacterium RBG_13_40_8]OGZ35080.1 MAG: histidine triad nucleotide-binding protein [Candidatus Portnoybacteria bacterium RIFCSPHIGHO2_01_FULL_39_19]
MSDCIFCNIINKNSPADILHEDDDFIVVKDIKPTAPVHLLIIPKEHIDSINHIEKKHRELIGDMFLLAKKTAHDYEISEGYKLAFNTGRKGGQLIDHLHLHLMGGWNEEQK